MNKDRKKDHRFFLFFHIVNNKKKAYIYVENWLSTAFFQGYIQSSLMFKVKVNNIRADLVINLLTNCATEAAY